MKLGWAGLALAVAVLLLRRLPAVLTLSALMEQIRGRSDALFAGWFGSIGAAALYYATFGHRETGNAEIWMGGSLIICASVLAHGLTATLLTKLYGSRAREREGDDEAREEDADPEER